MVHTPTKRLILLNRRRRSAFSPTDLSGLQLWLKADGTLWQDSARTIPATADADPVGAWDDASGNGNHVTQATSTKRPTLKLSILNGKPVTRFDGADDALSLTGTALDILKNVASASIFAVWKAADTGVLQRAISLGSSLDDIVLAALGKLATNEHSLRGRKVAADTAIAVSGAAMGTGFVLSAAVFDWGNSDASLYKRGILDASTTSFFTDGNTENASAVNSAIGSNASGTTGSFLNGDIAEPLIYVPKLSSTNQALVENYLISKYGL